MRAVREAGHRDVRLAMGHTKLVDEADMAQFRELDVIANFYTLEAAQPNTLASAARLPGIPPAAISVLAVYLRRARAKELAAPPPQKAASQNAPLPKDSTP